MSLVETAPVLLKKVVLERRLESNNSEPWGKKHKGKRFGIVLCQTSQQMAEGQDSACKDIFLPWGTLASQQWACFYTILKEGEGEDLGLVWSTGAAL